MFDMILLGMSLRLAVPTVPLKHDRVAVWHHEVVGSELLATNPCVKSWLTSSPEPYSIQVQLDFDWLCLLPWSFVKYNSGLFHRNIIWDLPSAHLALNYAARKGGWTDLKYAQAPLCLLKPVVGKFVGTRLHTLCIYCPAWFVLKCTSWLFILVRSFIVFRLYNLLCATSEWITRS